MLGSGLLMHGGVTNHPEVRQENDFLPLTHTLVNAPLLLQVATSQKRESGSKQRRAGERPSFRLGPGLHPSFIRAPGAGRSSKQNTPCTSCHCPGCPFPLGISGAAWGVAGRSKVAAVFMCSKPAFIVTA